MKYWILLLCVAGPLAITCHLLEWNPILTFACSAAALVPLGALMERSTDELADFLGPTLGGLLNATLGNAPELIIACLALSKGLQDVVKASIAGSILGNLLFANGISMAIGGWGRPSQRFSHESAGLNSNLLFLAVVALLVPAMFVHATDVNSITPGETVAMSALQIEDISFQVAVVLIIVYLVSLFYVIRKPKSATKPGTGEGVAEAVHGEAGRGVLRPLGMLLIVTLGVAFMSEILTDAIGPTATSLGLTTTFTGVFLLASAGNLAQTFNAVQFARRDNMELTLSTTVGSSTQVALLVAPVLVFVSIAMGNPMNLVFSKLELFGLLVATVAIRNTTTDGISNWIEGVLLVGVYALLGIAFFAA
jgi:Ca2+:H+ antiporter